MLGNQYFMGRRYYEAKNEFEAEIAKHPYNLVVKKKLIICYTQTNQIAEALNLFHEVALKDISLIINTDPVKDDCPCPELVEKLKSSDIKFSDKYEKYIVNGMIWLYCDMQNSLMYFKKAKELKPLDNRVKTIVNSIESYENIYTSK